MITIFLPCRAGSERIPKKNTKPFAGVNGGLLKIKLNQLIKVKEVDRIILSTDDEKVKEVAFGLSDKIIIDDRPKELADSSTSTDDLVKYIPNIITEGHVLWTHVTSPFLSENIYSEAINTYLKNLKKGTYDSLMTVNRIQSFLWDEKGSFNYDRNDEKWPRTQTLKELFEINSGIFINSIENYKLIEDRIGKKPYLMNTKGYSSFDIDWPDDFMLGEMIYKKLNPQN
ncbi:acylneuraminate cytidylyltransferase family protein [Algibacter sp.]|nr:acylneuraminate cytidylyltransferase family protein [Algibacter sp.]